MVAQLSRQNKELESRTLWRSGPCLCDSGKASTQPDGTSERIHRKKGPKTIKAAKLDLSDSPDWPKIRETYLDEWQKWERMRIHVSKVSFLPLNHELC